MLRLCAFRDLFWGFFSVKMFSVTQQQLEFWPRLLFKTSNIHWDVVLRPLRLFKEEMKVVPGLNYATRVEKTAVRC